MAIADSWLLVIGHTVTGNLSLVLFKLAQKLVLKTAHQFAMKSHGLHKSIVYSFREIVYAIKLG